MVIVTYNSRRILVNAPRPLRCQQQVDTSELTDASERLAKVVNINSSEVCIICWGFAAAATTGLNATQIGHCQAWATSVQSSTA